MSSNKDTKSRLILRYGEKCFVEELGLRTPEEIEEDRRQYTSKKQRAIMDELTYHHILEKSQGRKNNRRKWCSAKKYQS